MTYRILFIGLACLGAGPAFGQRALTTPFRTPGNVPPSLARGDGNVPAGAGDLLLSVEFAAHPVFRADGRDVHMNLPITPWEAALGATVKVPTLGREVDLKIPAGSQTGRKLRLKGKGLGGSKAGDQYVTLQIMTPPATGASAKRFYESMADEFEFDPRKKKS